MRMSGSNNGNNGGSSSGDSGGGSQGGNQRSNRGKRHQGNGSNGSDGCTRAVSGSKEKFSGETEALQECIFDSSSKRNMEQSVKAFNGIKTYCGKEWKNGHHCKCTIEHGEHPDMEEPEEPTAREAKMELKCLSVRQNANNV